MSDTPKTDAAVWDAGALAAEHGDVQCVPAHFARAQERRIAELEKALSCLLPGLMLDLRYADDDDDKDALRSRIDTVTSVLKDAQP